MNHHTRQGYERLYIQLIGRKPDRNDLYELHEYSNYQLLCQINKELVRQKCLQFSVDEVDAILSLMDENKKGPG